MFHFGRNSNGKLLSDHIRCIWNTIKNIGYRSNARFHHRIYLGKSSNGRDRNKSGIKIITWDIALQQSENMFTMSHQFIDPLLELIPCLPVCMPLLLFFFSVLRIKKVNVGTNRRNVLSNLEVILVIKCKIH